MSALRRYARNCSSRGAELGNVVNVVNVVECAVSLQCALGKRNTNVPPNECVEVRIGPNLGEVIADGEDRYGDAVTLLSKVR